MLDELYVLKGLKEPHNLDQFLLFFAGSEISIMQLWYFLNVPLSFPSETGNYIHYKFGYVISDSHKYDNHNYFYNTKSKDLLFYIKSSIFITKAVLSKITRSELVLFIADKKYWIIELMTYQTITTVWGQKTHKWGT